MKKVLSVFLAMLMLFGALSVGAFAEDDTTLAPSESTTGTPSYDPNVSPNVGYDWWKGEGAPCTADQAVLSFSLNGGTMKYDQQVWDFTVKDFVWQSGITGTYYMVPHTGLQTGGDVIIFPDVVAPNGLSFAGWECISVGASKEGQNLINCTFGATGRFVIPTDAGGQLIQFVARYTSADQEEDTMTKVMGILMKVFGTIIGLLLYQGDSEQGIALMQKIFSGLL